MAVLLRASVAVCQTPGSWAAVDSGTTLSLWGVAARALTVNGRATGQLVAVGEQGAIVTSDDGLTWRRQISGVTAWLTAVRWIGGYGRWFAVGDGGTILSSTDGLQWEREAAPTTARLNGLDWNGALIAIGEAGAGLLTRDRDGRWARTDPGFPERWMRGVQQNVVVGQGGAIFSEPFIGSGVWQAEPTPTSADLEAIAAGSGSAVTTGGVNIAVGDGGTILRGDPGRWTLVPSGTNERLRGICFKFSGGQTLITQTFRVSFGEFFAVGTHGTILRSSHGLEWQRDPAPTARHLNAVISTSDAVIAVGEGGTIVRLAGAPPRIARQPSASHDAQGVPCMDAGVTGEGAITYLWVALGGGAPYPVGENRRQPVPGPQASLPSRTYQLIASNAFGSVRSETFVANRFLNLSTLAPAGTGDATLVSGFTLAGNPERTRTVLIRAVGPTLRSFGVANPAPAPRLSVYSGAQFVAANAGWSAVASAAGVRAAIERSGAFPLPDGSADAALLLELPPGVYTAHVESGGSAAGTALLEVYDTAPPTLVSLVNLSARARVSPGEPALVGGLAIEGGIRKRVLIRAAGPALAALGVRDALARPAIAVLKGAEVVATAGAWGASADAALIRRQAELAGAFPFAEGNADSALLVELEAGNYTVQVSSADGGSGVALVEVYETR